MKHTPTPWIVADCRELDIQQLSIAPPKPDPSGKAVIIARIKNEVKGTPIDENDEANAKFICKAANCHDGLMGIVRGLVRIAEREPDTICGEVYDLVQAAKYEIRQAERL